MAIGLAPCTKLQRQFDEFARDLAGENAIKPPRAILDVFDRLLATNDEIKAKRESDLREERQRLQGAFQSLRSTPAGKSSPERNRTLRKIVLGTVVWMAAVFLYAWLFDPFEQGGWRNLDDEEMNKLIVISLLPVLAALVFGAYRKWVR